MNKNLTFISLAVLIFLVGSLTGVRAESVLQVVTAYLNPAIKVELDGAPLVAKDSSGTTLPPLLYQDRLYLPVRTIGESINVPIQWEDTTHSVIIGDPKRTQELGTEIDLLTSPFSRPEVTYDSDLLTLHGKTYNHGVIFETWGDDHIIVGMEDFGLRYGMEKDPVSWETVSFDIGMIGEGKVPFTVHGKQFAISEQDGMMHFEVDVSDTYYFKVDLRSEPQSDYHAKVVMTNIIAKR